MAGNHFLQPQLKPSTLFLPLIGLFENRTFLVVVVTERLNGIEIKNVFLQTGLPQNILAHIWYVLGIFIENC